MACRERGKSTGWSRRMGACTRRRWRGCRSKPRDKRSVPWDRSQGTLRWASPSVRVAIHEAVPDRQPQDAQVEQRRPVRDVVEIELDALAERRVAAPAVDLGPAGDAG